MSTIASHLLLNISELEKGLLVFGSKDH